MNSLLQLSSPEIEVAVAQREGQVHRLSVVEPVGREENRIPLLQQDLHPTLARRAQRTPLVASPLPRPTATLWSLEEAREPSPSILESCLPLLRCIAAAAAGRKVTLSVTHDCDRARGRCMWCLLRVYGRNARSFLWEELKA